MPDDEGAFDKFCEAFNGAKSAVAGWLENCPDISSIKRLSDGELRIYHGLEFGAGWNLAVRFPSGGQHRINLLLPRGFPWQPVRVALADPPPFGTWPHVERNGILCPVANETEVDPGDPVGVTVCMLDDSVKLVEQLAAGKLQTDFQDEFLSYWACIHGGDMITSLLQIEPPSRVVCLWSYRRRFFLADKEAELKDWLSNFYGKQPEDFSIKNAAFIWLGTPPLPTSYPSTGRNLRAMIEEAGGKSLQTVSDLIHERPKELIVGLGVKTKHGPAIAGVVLPSPSQPRYGVKDPLTRGFRPDKTPTEILINRFMGKTKAVRQLINRADPDWIHGRGQDVRAPHLREKSVTIVGCGSVGAAIATILAQAGVGSFVLIDPDLMEWANVGRHVLGASAVGRRKPEALSEKLNRDFPHINVTPHACDLDAYLHKHGGEFQRSDLIISATGKWSADSRIDAWQKEKEVPALILYAWLEAHACASHAVLIDRGGGLRTGFDRTGLPHFRVTEWGKQDPNRQEPACGALFQPYGAVELSLANGVIAELAIDALLGEAAGLTHRIWIASKKYLRQAGGHWSSTWKENSSFQENGNFICEKQWPTV